jgi:HlyD family secretion protein
MRKFFVVLVILLLLAAGGLAVRQHNAAATTTTAPAQTAVVTRGTIQQTVDSTGKVVSNLDVDIKCKASGTVINLPVDVSQSVKTGQLLVQLDPVDEKRTVESMEIAVKQSEARLEQSRQNLAIARQNVTTTEEKDRATLASAKVRAENLRTKADRQKQLLDQNLGSREEYETAETEAASAEADLHAAEIAIEDLAAQRLNLKVKEQDVTLAEGQVNSDNNSLSDANQRLADTTVNSPMDGVVSTLNIQNGTIISSAISNIGGGTTVMTLSDLSHIFVLASVDESDIGRVSLDQTVRITVDSYPEREFPGKVVRIATKGVNVSNVVTFEVKIEVLGPDKKLLKPEMTANVHIITAEHKNILVIPVTGVHSDGGKLVANVIGANYARLPQPVKLGLSDGDNCEVLSGLTEGQTIELFPEPPPSRWDQNGGPNN